MLPRSNVNFESVIGSLTQQYGGRNTGVLGLFDVSSILSKKNPIIVWLRRTMVVAFSDETSDYDSNQPTLVIVYWNF